MKISAISMKPPAENFHLGVQAFRCVKWPFRIEKNGRFTFRRWQVYLNPLYREGNLFIMVFIAQKILFLLRKMRSNYWVANPPCNVWSMNVTPMQHVVSSLSPVIKPGNSNKCVSFICMEIKCASLNIYIERWIFAL